jgi:LuxR family maltose regulon positive regulatory protein
VLERQPDDVRRLLLRTSILDRVNGALADILTGASGSEGILHGLERANAFVVAADPERSWFRYHSLFADLLRLELRRTESNVVRELHQAAAGWYAHRGYAVEAVRHAQAAEDWLSAAHMLADHTGGLDLRGQGRDRAGAARRLPGG